MGYTTDFCGTLKFNKPISDDLKTFINGFSASRRMARDIDKLKAAYPNWKELCFKGNLGVDGEYFIGDKPEYDFFGTQDPSIIGYNITPKTQPSLWCQWIIDDNGELAWDGREKFYSYECWLRYLISNFFAPEGYILNGTIRYQGENSLDYGIIEVKDNIVEKIEY